MSTFVTQSRQQQETKQMTTEKREFCRACAVHTFTAPFQGKPTRYKVTSVVGHVYTFVHLVTVSSTSSSNRSNPTERTLRPSTKTGPTLTPCPCLRVPPARWKQQRFALPSVFVYNQQKHVSFIAIINNNRME